MALKITAQEINKRWHIKTAPGDDPWTVLFQILSILDSKLEGLKKSIDQLRPSVEPGLAEAKPEEAPARRGE